MASKETRLAPIEIDPKTFLYSHCALPNLPTVVNELQQAVLSEDVSIAQVVEILSSDPGLVAEILKVVNSAYYGLPREVSRLDMAVSYLGLREVRNIALAASVINTFDIEEPVEFKRIWHHSFHTALCARHLAQRFETHLSAGDLWAPALLHDVGQIVYLKFFPEHYGALRRHADEEGCLFHEAEQQLDLPSSAYFANLLCERWRLPREVRQVCAFHGPENLGDEPDPERVPPLQRVVVLGDLVAVLSKDPLPEEKRGALCAVIMRQLGLTEAEFLVLMGNVSELSLEADRLARSG